MSRLYRGLWQVEIVVRGQRLAIEPALPLQYDQAAVLAAVIGQEGGCSAVLRRVPGSRAPWEFAAPFEASDNPRWGE